MISFGLICEGPSENRIIRYLTEKYMGDDIVINQKQPEIKDEKQKGYGGWLNVLKYCTEPNFDEILSVNDYIMVQIDTDACHEAGYDIKDRNEDGSEKSDEQLYGEIKSKILENITDEVIAKYDNKIIYAICFDEIECWLLPIYYTDNRRCSTTGCIGKLNYKLIKDGIGIPESDKNSHAAQKVYCKILKNLKKSKTIKEYSQYNCGFNKFIEQLDVIKGE